MEIWKDIVGYEGLYQVSNLGRVKSLAYEVTYYRERTNSYVTRPHKEQIVKPVTRQHGYLGVMLYGKGGHKTRGFKTFSIHRLVAEAFIPNPDGLPEVNHKDENKQNNTVDNLEWITRKGNVNYGTTQQRRANNRINNDKRCKRVMQISLDGKIIAEYPSLAEVQRQTGYSSSNIWNFINGKNTNKHQYGFIWRYAN